MAKKSEVKFMSAMCIVFVAFFLFTIKSDATTVKKIYHVNKGYYRSLQKGTVIKGARSFNPGVAKIVNGKIKGIKAGTARIRVNSKLIIQVKVVKTKTFKYGMTEAKLRKMLRIQSDVYATYHVNYGMYGDVSTGKQMKGCEIAVLGSGPYKDYYAYVCYSTTGKVMDHEVWGEWKDQ